MCTSAVMLLFQSFISRHISEYETPTYVTGRGQYKTTIIHKFQTTDSTGEHLHYLHPVFTVLCKSLKPPRFCTLFSLFICTFIWPLLFKNVVQKKSFAFSFPFILKAFIASFFTLFVLKTFAQNRIHTPNYTSRVGKGRREVGRARLATSFSPHCPKVHS